MKVVNFTIMKHPLNWLVIWSMVFILFFVGHLLISYFNGKHPGAVGSDPATGDGGPGTGPVSNDSNS